MLIVLIRIPIRGQEGNAFANRATRKINSDSVNRFAQMGSTMGKNVYIARPVHTHGMIFRPAYLVRTIASHAYQNTVAESVIKDTSRTKLGNANKSAGMGKR